jgi:hypothetical protein
VTATFSCTQTVVKACPASSFYVHHHHCYVFGGKGAVDQDFECCDVAADCKSDSLFFRFVGFVITNYFSLIDLSVFWDVSEFDKETCVGSGNVSNTLKKASAFIAKTLCPKWLQTGVFHKGRVFHFLSGDGVNDCIGLMCLGPMFISKGDGHVVGVHSTEVVLRQVARGKILRASWHPRR